MICLQGYCHTSPLWSYKNYLNMHKIVHFICEYQMWRISKQIFDINNSGMPRSLEWFYSKHTPSSILPHAQLNLCNHSFITDEPWFQLALLQHAPLPKKSSNLACGLLYKKVRFETFRFVGNNPFHVCMKRIIPRKRTKLWSVYKLIFLYNRPLMH